MLRLRDPRSLWLSARCLDGRLDRVVALGHGKTADWVIDLGPEGGAGGGKLLAEGIPEYVASIEESYTGQYLKAVLLPPRKARRRAAR